MKVHVAFDLIERRVISVAPSKQEVFDAVMDHFCRYKDNPVEMEYVFNREIVFSEHDMYEGAK